MGETYFLSTEYRTTWTEDEEPQSYHGKYEYLLKVKDGVIEYIGLERPYNGFAMQDDYPDGMVEHINGLREKFIGKTPRELYQSLPKPRGKLKVRESSIEEEYWQIRRNNFEDELAMAQSIRENKDEDRYVELSYRYVDNDESVYPDNVFLKIRGNKVIGLAVGHFWNDYPDNLDDAQSMLKKYKSYEDKFLGKTLSQALADLEPDIADNVMGYVISKEDWQKEERGYSKRVMIAQNMKEGKEKKSLERYNRKRIPGDPLKKKENAFENMPLYPDGSDYDDENKDHLKERKIYMQRNSSQAKAKQAKRKADKKAQGEDKLRARKREFKDTNVKTTDDETLMKRKAFIKKQRGME